MSQFIGHMANSIWTSHGFELNPECIFHILSIEGWSINGNKCFVFYFLQKEHCGDENEYKK